MKKNEYNDIEEECKCGCNHTDEDCDCGDDCSCEEHDHCGCGDDCDCEEEFDEKNILIEFLFLEIDTCERCAKTKENLFAAIDELRRPLETAGYSFEIFGLKIDSEELATEFEFKSSPTILVNFQDIFGEVVENICDTCSKLSNSETTCRVFVYDNVEYEVPPKGMIIEGILKAVFNEQPIPENSDYVIPQNIADFITKTKNS
ncbi:MAG: DUF2703 domain-containing protein [Clostridia bacterium]|nr:DUF2703 domain-containing protein [Clostridia bacterium]